MPDQTSARPLSASAIATVQSYIKLPFVYNHWYVAGLDEEFGDTPKAKTLLERSIVFFRVKSGELVALQNRCLHRSFPLADGMVQGDNLVCGYHGIEYDANGNIVRIPCQDRIPNRKLRKYPLRKKGPYVFIWMGDEEAPDESRLPAFEFLDDSGYDYVDGVKHIDGSYLLLMENLNDLTHFSFLHANSFAIGDHYGRLPEEVGKTEAGIFCHRLDKDWSRLKRNYPPEMQQKIEGREVLNRNGGITVGPGLFHGYSTLDVTGREGEEDFKLKTYVMHFTTPETSTRAHYWWALYKDFGFGSQQLKEASRELFSRAFDEDTVAIRSMQRLLDNDNVDYDELVIAGDKAGMLFRRQMLDWVREEHPDFE